MVTATGSSVVDGLLCRVHGRKLLQLAHLYIALPDHHLPSEAACHVLWLIWVVRPIPFGRTFAVGKMPKKRFFIRSQSQTPFRPIQEEPF